MTVSKAAAAPSTEDQGSPDTYHEKVLQEVHNENPTGGRARRRKRRCARALSDRRNEDYDFACSTVATSKRFKRTAAHAAQALHEMLDSESQSSNGDGSPRPSNGKASPRPSAAE